MSHYKILVSILIPILSLNCFASEVLNKGDPAPYPGLLFTQPEAKTLQIISIEHDSYKKTLDLEQQNMDLLTTKANLLTTDNNNLSKDLYEERQSSNLTKILWFGLGVVLTGATAYGVQKTLSR